MNTGIYDNVDEADYLADRDALSASGAKLILKAPQLFKYRQDHPEYRDVFDFGSAAHHRILGTGPKINVIDADDWRTKAAREQRDQARTDGEIPLLAADWTRVQAMADAVADNPTARQLLAEGKPEVSAYAIDEATGVRMRGRIDWLGEAILSDLKTVASADPDQFGATAARLGYAQQAEWYLDLARKCGHPARGFAFILVEKEPPYLTSVVVLDADAMDWGAERNRRAREIFRDCTESGIWPGFQPDGGFTTVSLPPWALKEPIT